MATLILGVEAVGSALSTKSLGPCLTSYRSAFNAYEYVNLSKGVKSIADSVFTGDRRLPLTKYEALITDSDGLKSHNIAWISHTPQELDPIQEFDCIFTALQGLKKVGIGSITINLNCTGIYNILDECLRKKLPTVPERTAFSFAIEKQAPTYISPEVNELYEIFSFKGKLKNFEEKFSLFISDHSEIDLHLEKLKMQIELFKDLRDEFIELDVNFCPALSRDDDKKYSGTLFTISCKGDTRIISHGEASKSGKQTFFEITTELPTMVEMYEKTLPQSEKISEKVVVFYSKFKEKGQGIDTLSGRLAFKLCHKFQKNGINAIHEGITSNKLKRLSGDGHTPHMVRIYDKGIFVKSNGISKQVADWNEAYDFIEANVKKS